MIRFQVRRTNKNAALLAGGLYSAAALLLVASAAGLGYRAVLQLLMLAALVAAIMLTERYYLASYEYVLEDTVGDYDLVVYRTLGRRRTAQCRMALSAAGRLTAAPAGQAEKPEICGRLYDYTGSLFPALSYLLTFPNDGATLRLEPDEAFAALLSRLLTVPETEL